ncbi:peptidase S15, partial [Streptomyces sp. SID11233]|nr:peptidase S15 [Streptomyces sp. SID11233]
EPLEPGRTYRATVRLNGIAQAFPAGHRLRLSLSTSYWPLAWPPPEPVMLAVKARASTLTLPVRPVRTPDEGIAFGEPEAVRPLATEQRVPPEQSW